MSACLDPRNALGTCMDGLTGSAGLETEGPNTIVQFIASAIIKVG